MTQEQDPTLQVGTFDTTEMGGGVHQDLTTVTGAWDATGTHPEGVAYLAHSGAKQEETEQ